jgi:isocitrate dehydrogenase
LVVKGNGKLELVFTPTGGQPEKITVFDFKKGGGVGMAMYNTDEVNCVIIIFILFACCCNPL